MGPAFSPPRFHSHRLLGFALLLICCGAVQPCTAQDVVTEFKGKVKAARGNLLVVTKEDDTEVTVLLNQNPGKFLFSATANPAGLRPGWLVRITGSFSPQGVATAPVNQFELFLPFAIQALAGHERAQYTPGIAPVEGEPNQYRVVGQIMGMNQQAVMIQTPRGPLNVPFAPDAKWLVRCHELSLVQPGDPVSVTGFYQPPDESKVMGDRVTIAVERVIGEATEPVGRRAAKPRRGAKAAKPEAEPDSEPAAAVPE